MNLNNFVVFPQKPKSVKLNVRNLRELRVETMQLSQENRDMESCLRQLQETMSRQKEEREKSGAFRWKFAHTQDETTDKERKLKSSPNKMKIKLLKDEPLPVERVSEPSSPKDGQSRKLRLKGKACGQCGARSAGLVCAECAEDYCVTCFAKFHLKGALRFHHIIPMQATLHTSLSTLDVVNHFQKKTKSEETEHNWLNNVGDERTDPECRATSTLFQSDTNDQMNDPQVLLVNDAEEMRFEENEYSGSSGVKESSRSFQQAMDEWAAENTHSKKEIHELIHNGQITRPVSVAVMGTQAEGKKPIHIEFMDFGLSYMERLLLKKHCRAHVESYHLGSISRCSSGQIPCTQPVEEIHELTAEEMDLHHYCASLFAVSSSAKAEEVNNIFKSCLSITEIDETAVDSQANALFGVKRRDDKNKNQVGNTLTKPVQAEEVLDPIEPLDVSLKTQTLANEIPKCGNPSSQPQQQPLLRHQKSFLSAVDSKDDEPYFLHLKLSSSSANSEILHSPSPHMSSTDSDMSSDSVFMLPTDEDSSDEEMKRCALQDMGEEKNSNTLPFPPEPVSFLSQSPMFKQQSDFFTKPSPAVSTLARRQNSVSTNYQGMDGFFVLGLKSRSVPLTPASSCSPPDKHTYATRSEGLLSGASTPVAQFVSHNLCPSSPVCHDVLKILEAQTVQQAKITHIKEDDEDLLTIICLEEEFKRMITEPK